MAVLPRESVAEELRPEPSIHDRQIRFVKLGKGGVSRQTGPMKTEKKNSNWD